MTFKLEKDWEGSNTVIRLIGRIRSEHLEELKTQMGEGRPTIVLDLDEVTLVDVDVIRFLRTSEGKGIELRRCPPYIREWIFREQKSSEQ
ncbi:MAG TPA: hypothetical protein VI636_07155 [Candidatus Angelobacter sp.]